MKLTTHFYPVPRSRPPLLKRLNGVELNKCQEQHYLHIPSTPRSPKLCLPYRFSGKVFTCFSLPKCVLHVHSGISFLASSFRPGVVRSHRFPKLEDDTLSAVVL